MAAVRDLGEVAIKDVIAAHPAVGEVLSKHSIECVKCMVGVCLFKDILKIHNIVGDEEARINNEIELAIAESTAA
jgi:hypothetical protein